jgi:ligand-binding sensor domain-containing protein
MKKSLLIFGFVFAGGSVGFGAAFPPTGTWTSYTNASDIYVLAPGGPGIWAGTTGGALYDEWNQPISKYTNAEGLPANDVRAVGISSSGEIWFGLNGSGVSRFTPSSNTWRQYTTYDGLEQDSVISVLVDGTILWFGMDVGTGKRGLVRFDDAGTPDNRQDDEWTPFDSLAGLPVQALGLKGDTLWIATRGGLYRTIRINSYPYLTQWQRHLWGYIVTSLAFENGAVWAGTMGGGVFRWDGIGWTPLNNGLPSLNVYGLALSGSQFWAATDGGMVLYDVANIRWNIHNEGLTVLEMRRVALDASGHAWAGGNQSGLWSWDGVQWQKIFLNQIAYDWIDHLHLGSNSEVLVSHGYKGTGASLLSQGQWDTLRVPLARDTSNWIAAVLVAGDGLWLGSWGGGLFHRRPNGAWDRYTQQNTNNGLRTNYIAEMTLDPQGTLYVGAWWDAVSQFSSDRSTWTSYSYSGISRMPFRSILVDRRGRVWCGMDDQGLAVYDHGSWAYYSTGSDPAIPNNHVSDIAEDDSGNIWIATWGGVAYFDGHSFISFTKDKTSGGLPSDQTEAISIDSQGWVWVGTYGGLGVYDPQRKRWANYFQGARGVVSNNIRKLRIRPDPQDTHRDQIWIGTTNGLSLFIPDNPSPADLVSVNVFPNPFRPKTGLVTFQGLPDGAEVWIYTTSGDLVKHLSFPDPHQHSLTWDGRNSSGHGVASGLFPYVVKGAGQTRGGTLAILR